MKLLVYSHFFAPSVGGVENIALSLAQGLAELRLPDGRPEFELMVITQTPAANFDDKSLPFAVVRQPTLIQLLSMIRACDAIHLAGPALVPVLFARLAGKPAIIEHHGYQSVCPNGLLFHHPTQSACPGHFRLRNYRECIRCNRQNEGPSKSIRLLIWTFLRRHLCMGVCANLFPTRHVADRNHLPRSRVIFHGIEDRDIGRANTFNPSLFAYLGRLVREKGLPVLVEAVRLLRRDRCHPVVKVIGDGPERVHLQKQISASGLEENFRLTGLLLGDHLTSALDDVGTVVMPTLMEETAGLAVMEQMMRARLVIASDIGGLAEVVGAAGLLFPPGNGPALAARMKQAMQGSDVISTIGGKARERAQLVFARPTMIAEHAAVYRALLQRPGNEDPNRQDL